MNIKILACEIIGPAAAGSAGPVPTALQLNCKFGAEPNVRQPRAVSPAGERDNLGG